MTDHDLASMPIHRGELASCDPGPAWMPPRPLTSRQREILRWIEAFIERERMPPTLREIGAGIGIGSTNGVVCALEILERKGFIAVGYARARAIRILHRHNEGGTPS